MVEKLLGMSATIVLVAMVAAAFGLAEVEIFTAVARQGAEVLGR